MACQLPDRWRFNETDIAQVRASVSKKIKGGRKRNLKGGFFLIARVIGLNVRDWNPSDITRVYFTGLPRAAEKINFRFGAIYNFL